VTIVRGQGPPRGRAGACRTLAALCAGLLLGAAACASDYIEVRSVIQYEDSVRVQVPGHFDVGVPSPVSVWTVYGGCDRPGETAVTIRDLLVVIEPHDLVPAPGVDVICPDALTYENRVVDVTVRQAGDVTVRFIGRGALDTLVTFDTVVVAR
jgi:hypothetical protein